MVTPASALEHSDAPYRIKRPILVPLIAAFLFLLATFTLTTLWFRQVQKTHFIQHNVSTLSASLPLVMRNEAAVLKSLLELIPDNPHILAAFKAQDREALIAFTQPIYRRLNHSHDITHFYFSTSDRVSFLRVHNPPRHDDRIDRHTTLEAQRTGRVAFGAELGPFGTMTLRVVMPWQHDGEVIGFIELGKEVSHMVDQLATQPQLTLMTFIEKAFLNADQWREGMRMIGHDKARWDRFDALVFSGYEDPDQLPLSLSAYIASRRWRASTPLDTIFTSDDELNYFSLPLTDAVGRTVGRIIGVQDTSLQRAAARTHATVFLSVALVVLLLLTALFSRILERVERRIRNTTRALMHSEESLKKAQKLAAVGNWDWHIQGNLFWASDTLLHILKQPPGHNFPSIRAILRLFQREDRKGLLSCIREARKGRKPPEMECRLLHTGGATRHLLCLVEGELDAHGHPIRLLGTMMDITEKRAMEHELKIAVHTFDSALSEVASRYGMLSREKEEMERLSNTDTLTGLGNRRHFVDNLEHALTLSRAQGKRLAVLYMDLDRFKPVNDTHGHEVGDLLLKEAAQRLQEGFRLSDRIFRIGGDEFGAILPNCESNPAVLSAAQRTITTLSRPFLWQDRQFTVGLSVGIAIFPEHGWDSDTLLRHADAALYRVKAQGGGQAHIFIPAENA